MTIVHGDSKLSHHCLKRMKHLMHFLVSIDSHRLSDSFTAVYPGGVWNLQIATLGDDPQEVDFAKAEALCIR